MTPSPDQSQPDTDDGGDSPASKKHDAFERATLATAIIGVVILIVYTGLTGYQAYISKDTAERQLRAYISVAVEKQPDLNGSAPPEVVLLFKNVGQTPAFKVRALSVFSVLSGHTLSVADLSSIRAYMDTMKGNESVAFPGQEFRESPEVGKGLPFTESQKISVSMGAMTLWVNGEVTYDDAFGHPHFTRFRLLMNGAEGNRYNRLIWADTGNEAD